MKVLTIYTDGGSRGNPGPAALGVVIKEGDLTIHKIGKTLGITTNNVAEYSAILEALQWISQNRELIGDISGINFFMDSLLACQQLKGLYRVKQPHLQALMINIRKIELSLRVKITYTHVPREKNKEADAMVNLALDNNL
ncbi:MAG TPA: ribonuclease HI family protein [Patescibacteria group bacterium]